jgi:large conductance mechanosensitive channel
MWKELKKFALKGNVLDLAVGIILGTSFTTIVNSLVKDIIMPPIGLLLGSVDFANLFALLKQGAPAGPYASLAAAQEAGAVTINYGVFINAIVSFAIVALVLFFIIRGANALQKQEPAPKPAAPTTKVCPFCKTDIPIEAVRCPNCTSQLSTE